MVSNQDCLTASAAQKLVNDPNYEIEEYVGKGAMACVYKATERGTPNVYAMKLLRERYRTDTQFIEFFQREAVSMRDLQYPNIVRFYTYSVQDDYAYILMDYVEGMPLTRLISQARRKQEMIPLDLIIATMAQIARAISYLHRQKYVHRDIKPGNVLLKENNAAFLTDLGIAGMVTKQEDDDLYLGAGTPSYMPYEQQTFQIIDHTADIYAFAVMMYEMFTAKKPFIAESGLNVKEARKQMVELHRNGDIDSLLERRPELPPAIDGFFKRALAKEPHDRYQDVMDFAKDVHEALVKANLISASLHDFDVIKPQPILQTTATHTAPVSADVPYEEKPKRVLQGRYSMVQLLVVATMAMVLIVIVVFAFSQWSAQDAPSTTTDIAASSSTIEPAETTTEPLATETIVPDFFADGALLPLALNTIVAGVDTDETVLADGTLLNLLVGSEGEAVISLSDSVDAFEMTVTLDAMPIDDAFSYGVRFADASVAVVGQDGTLALLYDDMQLASYDEASQLPQTLTVRVRADAVQIETTSFDGEVAIYDNEATPVSVSELSLTFADLVPEVMLETVTLLVVGEDISIESLPALTVLEDGARALRQTGTASDVITCPAFITVYDGIQVLRTADGVNALLTDIERINNDVRDACEDETSITAGLGWADEMDALIASFVE